MIKAELMMKDFDSNIVLNQSCETLWSCTGNVCSVVIHQSSTRWQWSYSNTKWVSAAGSRAFAG